VLLFLSAASRSWFILAVAATVAAMVATDVMALAMEAAMVLATEAAMDATVL
jgi:hypothetical protein